MEALLRHRRNASVFRVCTAGLLASSALGLCLSAWALNPSKKVSQYVRDAWTTENGLPENSVDALIQTRDGYLWIGTQEGLARFDGVRFTVFDRENTPEMRNADIMAMVENSDGVLWIGTQGGGVTRIEKGAFTNYSADRGLINDVVLSLALDSKGGVWARSENGVSHIEGDRVTGFTADTGLLGSLAYSMAVDPVGDLWVGTDEGLNRISGTEVQRFTEKDGLCGGPVRLLAADATGLWVISAGGISRWQGGRLLPVLKVDLSKDKVRVALEDSDGALWIGGQLGLYRFEGGRLTKFGAVDGLPSDFVRQLMEDRDHNLWIGTQEGLARYQGGAFQVYGPKQGLTGSQIQSLFEDREGSIWAGTDEGLDRFKDGRFTCIGIPEGLSRDLVWVILQDHRGDVWVGTESGLNRLRGDEIEVYGKERGLASATAQSLYEDAGGDLWVGTWGAGLQRMRDGRFIPFEGSGKLSGDFVTVITGDGAGGLWIGSFDSGVRHLRDGEVTTLSTKEGLGSNTIRTLLRTEDGSLWIGSDNGLSLFRDGKIRTYTMKDGLLSNLIFAVRQDRDGSLWVGTMNGGLSHFKDGAFHNFTSHNGLTSDSIFTILEDDEGYFWLTSNKGICRVLKADLLRIESGATDRAPSTHFGLSDGMRSFECNGSSQPCGWKTRDGRLWFATTRGVAVIDPDDTRRPISPPPTVLVESVTADGKPVDVGRPGLLVADTKEIELRYTATSLLWPDRIRFRYMLEGYRSDWVEVPHGRERIATFTNLPPGRYVFRVNACNSEGVWSATGASWIFRRKPHFYQTLWFYALCLLGTGAAIFGGYRYKTRRLEEHRRELQLLVQERTRSLEERTLQLEQRSRELEDARAQAEAASLAKEEARQSAEAASRAKTQFLANMSHELRTPMNAIIGFSQILEDQFFGPLTPKQKEHVTNILQSAQHLLSLINDILDLAKVESGRVELEVNRFIPRELMVSALTMVRERAYRHGIQLDVVYGQDSDVAVEGDARKIKQILFNLLSNAVKFTPKGKGVTLEAALVAPDEGEDGRRILRMSVRDEGIGIREEDMDKLFRPFTQLESAYTKRFEGTGLGLALTQKLVELQGGRISVESTFGEGSRFEVEVPVVLAAGQEAQS